MTTDALKELKMVVISFSIGAIVVFINAVLENNLVDYIYSLCILIFLLRYILICKE